MQHNSKSTCSSKTRQRLPAVNTSALSVKPNRNQVGSRQTGRIFKQSWGRQCRNSATHYPTITTLCSPITKVTPSLDSSLHIMLCLPFSFKLNVLDKADPLTCYSRRPGGGYKERLKLQWRLYSVFIYPSGSTWGMRLSIRTRRARCRVLIPSPSTKVWWAGGTGYVLLIREVYAYTVSEQGFFS